MKSINTEHSIIPIGEFKARASRLLSELKASDVPLVVTQNGRAAAVVLSPRAFDALSERNRLLEAIAAGLADVEAGELVEHGAVEAWLASWGSPDETDPPA